MTSHVAEIRLSASDSASVAVLRTVLRQVARLLKNLNNRREVKALGELDPYLLKDIGLHPSDVVAALDRPWSQDPSSHLATVAAGRSKRPATH